MSLRALFALVLLTVVCGAAPLTRDLGEGVTYVRVRALPADLPEQLRSDMVLDLRFARTDSAASAALAGWLQFRSAPDATLVILINRETHAEIRQTLTQTLPLPGTLLIGPASADPAPDLELESDPELERLAYTALERDTSVESLIRENTAKPRHDEASFSGTRRELAELEPSEAELSDDPPRETPLVDHALQRAVHVHRAFRALPRGDPVR